jgi:hypothetical protein
MVAALAAVVVAVRRHAHETLLSPGPVALAVLAAFWAYAIADTLVRELGKDATFADPGALFILGVISGLSLGLVLAWRQGRVTEAR